MFLLFIPQRQIPVADSRLWPVSAFLCLFFNLSYRLIAVQFLTTFDKRERQTPLPHFGAKGYLSVGLWMRSASERVRKYMRKGSGFS